MHQLIFWNSLNFSITEMFVITIYLDPVKGKYPSPHPTPPGWEKIAWDGDLVIPTVQLTPVPEPKSWINACLCLWYNNWNCMECSTCYTVLPGGTNWSHMGNQMAVQNTTPFREPEWVPCAGWHCGTLEKGPSSDPIGTHSGSHVQGDIVEP